MTITDVANLAAMAVSLVALTLVISSFTVARRERRRETEKLVSLFAEVQDRWRLSGVSDGAAAKRLPDSRFAWSHEIDDADDATSPEVDGPFATAHRVTVRFDLGRAMEIEEFREAISDCLFFIEFAGDQQDLQEIRVARSSYRNPLELIFYIWAAPHAVGAFIGVLLSINAGAQRVVRSTSRTFRMVSDDRTREAENLARQARAQAVATHWNNVSRALGLGPDVPDTLRDTLIEGSQWISGVWYEPPAMTERADEGEDNA